MYYLLVNFLPNLYSVLEFPLFDVPSLPNFSFSYIFSHCLSFFLPSFQKLSVTLSSNLLLNFTFHFQNFNFEELFSSFLFIVFMDSISSLRILIIISLFFFYISRIDSELLFSLRFFFPYFIHFDSPSFMMEVFPKCMMILGCLFLLKAELIDSSVCVGVGCWLVNILEEKWSGNLTF